MADNTLHAYRRDLEDMEDWFSGIGKTLLDAAADDFRLYLQDQTRKGQSTRTVARRLAAIRVFLRFLPTIGHDTTGILTHLERPKPEQSLPKVLSRAQVNQLIAAPKVKTFLHARDVAILELLYASGLRASELCELTLRDLNLQVGFVRVLGKGSKERIVPVGGAAVDAIRALFARVPAQARPPDVGSAVCFAHGKADGAHRSLVSRGKIWPAERIAEIDLAAYATTLFRHAPHRRRGRSSRRSGTARTQRHQHDADLHARRSRPAEGRP